MVHLIPFGCRIDAHLQVGKRHRAFARFDRRICRNDHVGWPSGTGACGTISRTLRHERQQHLFAIGREIEARNAVGQLLRLACIEDEPAQRSCAFGETIAARGLTKVQCARLARDQFQIIPCRQW